MEGSSAGSTHPWISCSRFSLTCCPCSSMNITVLRDQRQSYRTRLKMLAGCPLHMAEDPMQVIAVVCQHYCIVICPTLAARSQLARVGGCQRCGCRHGIPRSAAEQGIGVQDCQQDVLVLDQVRLQQRARS